MLLEKRMRGVKMALVELKGVSKVYARGANQVAALAGVDLSIYRGEFVAVMGQSGSGKSTLMNIIGCLDAPTAGQYLLDQKEVEKLGDDELSVIRNHQIGFIFQGFNLIACLNAIENVELPLIYRKLDKWERRALAARALERVGLADRLYHRPGQLSGGQQQRVAIARAIAAKPPVILADEPTGNLDTASGEAVMSILYDLWREGRTVVLITHDPRVAGAAERRIELRDGKVIADTKRGAKTGAFCIDKHGGQVL